MPEKIALVTDANRGIGLTTVAALTGIGDSFSTVHDHHFKDYDLPLFEKARRILRLMNEYENRICGILLDALRTLPVCIYG